MFFFVLQSLSFSLSLFLLITKAQYIQTGSVHITVSITLLTKGGEDLPSYME